MHVHLTIEQEAHLSQIAEHRGQHPEQLLLDAALSLMEEDAEVLSILQARLAAADRGEFLTQKEVTARVKKMLGDR